MNHKKSSNRCLLIHLRACPSLLSSLKKPISHLKESAFARGRLQVKTDLAGELLLKACLPEELVDPFLEKLNGILETASPDMKSGLILTIMDEKSAECALGQGWANLTTEWKVRFIRHGQKNRDVKHANDKTIFLYENPYAFGSGLHPSTRLAARALELLCSGGKMKGARVLDVGTGSGILSILSVRLGAKWAVAIDIDEEIVKAADANILLNKVQDRVSTTTIPLSKLHLKQVDVIVANLTPSVTFDLMDAMVQKLAPEGCLILSGHSLRVRDEICNRLGELGLQMRKGFSQDNWSAELFVFRR